MDPSLVAPMAAVSRPPGLSGPAARSHGGFLRYGFAPLLVFISVDVPRSRDRRRSAATVTTSTTRRAYLSYFFFCPCRPQMEFSARSRNPPRINTYITPTALHSRPADELLPFHQQYHLSRTAIGPMQARAMSTCRRGWGGGGVAFSRPGTTRAEHQAHRTRYAFSTRNRPLVLTSSRPDA